MKKFSFPLIFSRRQFLGTSGAATLAALLPGLRLRAAVRDQDIAYAKIHPAIGVARIGNSTAKDDHFFAPEVMTPPPTNPDDMRDVSGALKRQAARFRIYAYNKDHKVIGEITSDQAEIEWQVHVANTKADWFQFRAAMDLSESADLESPRRNADIKGDARKDLRIDPGPRKIKGPNQSGDKKKHVFNGKFLGTPVSLGEIRTDAKGRLIFLGGLGKSASVPAGKPVFNPADEFTFNNADGWYDDSSDGPVSAQLKINGRAIDVTPAWVVVAPPNYAPDIIGWRTMRDLIIDSFWKEGKLVAPETPSFVRDIMPIFKRLAGLQWVNKGLADRHGKGSSFDFGNDKFIARLADKSETQLHTEVYKLFHIQGNDPHDRNLRPMHYGDAYGSFPNSPENNLQVVGLRAELLKKWVEGKYTNDLATNLKVFRALTDVPVEAQPMMLDASSLHFCLADAFHPGCELTWPMRHVSMYSELFRIKLRPANTMAPGLGDKLTQKNALAVDGPLYAQGPGDLTRWMAVPWQGDTVFCRSGYEPDFDPYLLTFWPARVPNHVLTREAYTIVMDKNRPRAERLAAFKSREHWVRTMTGSAPDQILQMVREFSEMGLIVARPGIQGDPDFPEVIYVESLPPSARAKPKSVNTEALGGATRSAPAPGSADAAAQKAGWENAAQLEEFRRLRRIK